MQSNKEREKAILKLLTDDSTLSVTALSAKLGVSVVTVRNDLNALAEQGLIVRSHGGASVSFHPDIIARQGSMTAQKNAVAKQAASLVKDGDTIMIEAGTTTALIAGYLLGKRDVHIVTNSTLIIPYARSNPSLHITVIGGEFRPSTESLVGPIALRDLEQFHVSHFFIGTDGFSPETGLTTHLVESAEVAKRMASQADKTVLVADAAKYGKAGFVKVLPLSEVDMLITDNALPEAIRNSLSGNGLEIIIANVKE